MPTLTAAILARDHHRCAYCGGVATHRDHIVPIALRRRHKGYDGPEYQVAACSPCNWRKGTRRLVPPSWAHRIGELPSGPWRVWGGSPEGLRTVIR